MPLDPDIRKQYPDDWSELRTSILERSMGTGPLDRPEQLDAPREVAALIRSHYDGPSQACERCGVPQDETVLRHDGLWSLDVPELPEFVWFNREGEPVTADELDEGHLPSPGEADRVEVLLSVAHQCQDPRCDDLDHLLALCRRCHMRLDFQPEHFYTRKLLYRELKGQQRLDCCREPGCEVVTNNKV